MTDDGNGQDQQQEQEQPAGLPIMALIVINPETGALGLQVNDNIVQDRLKFFLAVGQLALGNANNEHDKAQSSKILVPKRQVARL